MSTNQEQGGVGAQAAVGERTMAGEARAVTMLPSPIADPAALGLAGFAFTTFLLSASNAGWMTGGPTGGTGAAWLGYAFGYGGLVQLLAGMWEFRNKNVFGSTAFGTYGGFWIGLALWDILVAPKAHSAVIVNHDIAWILIATFIFNTYMMFWSMQVNGAVFGVFLTLEATEIILIIGLFLGNLETVKIGGYVGVLTALVAWYTSAAAVTAGMEGRMRLPVGRPLVPQLPAGGRP